MVKQILEKHPEFELDPLRKKKQLACLNPGFSEELEQADRVIRMSPSGKAYDGFFVAVFKRRKV